VARRHLSHEIRSSWLHDNEAPGPTVGWGGTVLLWDGASLTVEDSVLSNNNADGPGGAIQNGFANSSITVRRTRIEGNIAHGGSAGVDIEGGPLTLANPEIVNNNTPNSGGEPFYANGTNGTIAGTTFEGNRSGGAAAVSNFTGASEWFRIASMMTEP
jgi:hypothetical protein